MLVSLCLAAILLADYLPHRSPSRAGRTAGAMLHRAAPEPIGSLKTSSPIEGRGILQSPREQLTGASKSRDVVEMAALGDSEDLGFAVAN